MVGGSLWISGGVGASGSLLADTWQFSFSSRTWRRAQASAAPPARYLASAFEGSTGQFCVFGGAEVASAGLLVTTPTGTPSLYCLSTATPDGSWTTESATGATAVAGASAAAVTGEVAILGGIAAGVPFAQTQRWDRSSRLWTLQPAANDRRSYSAAGLNAPQAILWRFGGLATNGSAMLATTVVAAGPPPTWMLTEAGCEAGYNGDLCQTPVCRRDCWGVGRCIAPDLCECQHGFTGPLCAQQLCSTCNVGLLSLNQPIYWPLARGKAQRCLSTIQSQIRTIKALLPSYPATCGATYSQSFPLNLTVVSKSAWDFRVGPATDLVTTTAATLAALQIGVAEPGIAAKK